MLPSRWGNLIKYGLLGTTLVGAAGRSAAADSCDEDPGTTLMFVLGIDVAPTIKLVGGLEVRHCLSSATNEGLVRLEVGGDAPRVLVGARARPFQSRTDDPDSDQLGLEAGATLDLHARFGVDAALAYGIPGLYASLQFQQRLGEADTPTRFTLLGGVSPWTVKPQPMIVDGRPLVHRDGIVRPGVTYRPAARDAESGAVRDHFTSAAQLELSSVWTFLRLAAELAATGAPAHLVAAALDAADDEVRHAELCAGAAGGVALAALPAWLAQPRFTTPSPHALRLLAVEAWRDGCLNETAAAEEARLASHEADPTTATLLASIARDETGHAELSWSILGWIASVAPDLATAAVAAVPPARCDALVPIDPALARRGVPRADVRAAARAFAHTTAAARWATLAG